MSEYGRSLDEAATFPLDAGMALLAPRAERLGRSLGAGFVDRARCRARDARRAELLTQFRLAAPDRDDHRTAARPSPSTADV